jgi:hypothetical protein
MLTNTSSTSKTERHLMSIQEEMRKEDKSSFGTNMERLTRDGRSSILTKLRKCKVREFIRTSDSTSIDHSISDPDSQ